MESGKLSRVFRMCYGGPLRPPTAPLAAAARPHLILRPERARLRYAHRLRSLQYRAQRCTRARPADSVRVWPRLAAFAHKAGSSAAIATKYIFGAWRYGSSDRLRSALCLVPSLLSAPLLTLALNFAAVVHGAPGTCTHLLLPNDRFAAARRRRPDRHHYHHRQRGRRRRVRRRLRFF